DADFEELVRLVLTIQMSRLASQADKQLQQHSGQPAFWAADLRQLLAEVRRALPNPAYTIPYDLSAICGDEDARPRFQRLVGRFGELLQAWPAIVSAARELRARGVRPADRL